MKLALQSTDRVVEKRWVYVLDIDCHGKGRLLYPRDYAENQFPNGADTAVSLSYRARGHCGIGPPYGVDTLIMLSTQEPLPDPYVLNFEGVATRGARGADSPLQKLLAKPAAGLVGIGGEVPTNWGIGVTTLHSIPKE